MRLLQMAFIYFAAMVVAFGVTVLVTRICRHLRQRHYEIPARDISKGHRWCMSDLFHQPTYCSISENHIIHGAYCDSCGICVEDRYVKEANKKLKCKDLSNRCESQRHHWIRGNLPLCSKCTVCGEDCGDSPHLCDLVCCWCGRTVHSHCVGRLSDTCDLGPFSSFIVPPHCVRLKLVGFKGRRHLVVSSVKPPERLDWKPLIVIANRKSGNGDGQHILQAFRRLLNPAQVIDLSEIPPQSGLEWCHLLPRVDCRVLVAGGDGTVGWVLHAIDDLKLQVLHNTIAIQILACVICGNHS